MKLLCPLILLVGSVGCARRDSPPEPPWVPAPDSDLGAIVARVGSVPIYARQVAAQAASSKSPPREALDQLISLNLLAEKAHQMASFRPNWHDPELRSALAERLIERDIWPQVRPDRVPDQELRAIYQKAITSFVHTRLVDVAILAVFTGQLMKEKPRTERAESAQALAAHVASTHARSPEDFEAIARDPAWRDRSVTFRRTLQSLDEPFSPKVGAAVAKLRAAGDTTPLIEDGEGFFIATYVGERPPENISFAEVREQIRQRYYEHWRAQRIEQIARKLEEGHRVESHPQLLNQAAPGHES